MRRMLAITCCLLLFAGLPPVPSARAAQDGEIYFLGDDHFKQVNWNGVFSKVLIQTQAENGSTTEDVLRMVSAVAPRHPAKVFLSVGINDLLERYSVNSILSTYRDILKQFRSRSPQTEVYVHSIPPVNNLLKGLMPRNFVDVKAIEKINRKLQMICAQYGATYIDVYTPFLNPQKELSEEYTQDGFHLNLNGYSLWKKKLEPYIRG